MNKFKCEKTGRAVVYYVRADHALAAGINAGSPPTCIRGMVPDLC